MRRIVIAGLAMLVSAGFAQAADPGFLKPSEMYDPAHFLPPPPEDGSPRALAELAETKKLMAEATPAERAAAASDNDNENGTIFAVVLGPAWDLSKLPATAKVINEVTATEGPFSDIAKAEFHRKRPWVIDTSIQTCAPHRPSQEWPPIPAAMPRSAMAWAWCWPI